MSKYSLTYLRNNTLVGDVSKNGLPWTARCLPEITDENYSDDLNGQGLPWLFSDAVPVSRVREHFNSFAVESRPIAAIRPARDGDKERDDVWLVRRGKETFAVVMDDSRQIVSDIMRDTNHFVPKAGYVIHDFEETLISRTGRIVGESDGDLHIDSAGILADGAEAWVSISTGSLMSTPEGVDFYPHLLASSSHNGTLATTIQAVNTMTVCDNTRAMALGEGKANGTVTKSRHSKMSAARLEEGEDEARQAMGLIVASAEEFSAEIKRQCEITVTDSQWNAFLDSLSPVTEGMSKAAVTRSENFRDSVSLLYAKDERVSPWKGTAFGALQALSTFDLWERQAYGTTDHFARNMRESITGKVQEREAERARALFAVLNG